MSDYLLGLATLPALGFVVALFIFVISRGDLAYSCGCGRFEANRSRAPWWWPRLHLWLHKRLNREHRAWWREALELIRPHNMIGRDAEGIYVCSAGDESFNTSDPELAASRRLGHHRGLIREAGLYRNEKQPVAYRDLIGGEPSIRSRRDTPILVRKKPGQDGPDGPSDFSSVVGDLPASLSGEHNDLEAR